MPSTEAKWHRRFQIQASWTEEMRSYVWDRFLASRGAGPFLEIGSGTGAALENFAVRDPGQFFACDINEEFLRFSSLHQLAVHHTAGDTYQLPFQDDAFSAVFCHYFLMWLEDPLLAILEIKRVTQPQGMIIAFAEPDYGGRLDFPEEFFYLKNLQIQSLRKAGADPLFGRGLRYTFQKAGLKKIFSGVYENRWRDQLPREEAESEWEILQDDLETILKPAELEELHKIESTAWEKESRLIFVPTFYAWGFLP